MTVNNPQPYPQPYGQQSFGQQQSGQMGIETLNMSDALSIAWNHFTRQWVPWVLSSVIVAIAFGVPFFIMYFALLGWIISMEESATSSSYSRYDSYNSYNNTTTEPAFNPFALGGISIAFMLIIVVGMVLFVIFTLNSYRNALRMTQGEVIKTTDFFRISGLGKPFLVQIVMGIAILPVALLTFGLGAIVLVIMWMYVMVAAFANPNASIGEIFGDGFRAFKNNMGQSILLVVVLPHQPLGWRVGVRHASDCTSSDDCPCSRLPYVQTNAHRLATGRGQSGHTRRWIWPGCSWFANSWHTALVRPNWWYPGRI